MMSFLMHDLGFNSLLSVIVPGPRCVCVAVDSKPF